jgi:hypothetical protein
LNGLETLQSSVAEPSINVFPFLPTVDDDFLSDVPDTLLQSGKRNNNISVLESILQNSVTAEKFPD